MTSPQPLVVPVPQISWLQGVPQFVVLSDIYDVPGIDMFEVTCITDFPCMLMLSWERTNPPADPGGVPLSGTVSDVGPTTFHRLTVPDGTIAQQPRQQIAQEVRYTIGLDPSDTSVDAQGVRRELREYVGTLKLRQAPWNFVPVRFYDFGGTPPPPVGGDEGDWNTYAWAQYNPNGQPFTHLPLAYYDILGTNGAEVFPAVRIYSRYHEPTGSGRLQIALDYPIPDVANAIPTAPDPLQDALFSVYFGGTLRERFAWRVSQPGEEEAIERFIRIIDESRYIRPARIIVNPSSVRRPTFLGPNYWLVTQAQVALNAPPAPAP